MLTQSKGIAWELINLMSIDLMQDLGVLYGMGVKTGKTVAYNPAVFNKINFFLKEFQSFFSSEKRLSVAAAPTSSSTTRGVCLIFNFASLH